MAESEFGRNLVDTFQRAVRARGADPFLWAKRQGTYRPQSWREVQDEVQLLARCLVQLGLAPGDRVSIVAENRPKWCIADLAVLTAGGVTVPTYTTNTTEDHTYLLQHSEARGIICAGKAVLQRLLPA